MKPCPYCAEEIQDAAIVCRFCGRTLDSKFILPFPKNKIKLNKKIIVPGLFLLLLVGVLSGGWYIGYSPRGFFPAATATQSALRMATQQSISKATQAAVSTATHIAEVTATAEQAYQLATIDSAMNGPCGLMKVDAALPKIADVANRFSDTLTLASSTSRIALSAPINKMQDLRRELESIQVPVCLSDAKIYFLTGMDENIEAYLNFMAQESNNHIEAHLKKANDYIGMAVSEMEYVRGCAPDCK